MARIIRTDPFPTTGEIAHNVTVVTLHAGVAASLKIPHLSLRHLALDALKGQGLSPAAGLIARHLLKQAISSVMTGVDPSAEATRIAGSLDVVLRTGIDPTHLIATDTARVQNLGRIAAAYKELLRARSLVDQAEVFDAASSLSLTRLRLCVFGYFRARSEEARFIDTICGDASEYFLPIENSRIFEVNRRWSEWLGERGWQIERSEQNASSFGSRLAARYVDTHVADAICPAFSYRNITDECRGVLSQVKRALADGSPAHSMAIVCRDQTIYAPVLAEIAYEYQIPLRFRNEIPIGQTAFGGFVNALIEAVASELGYEAGARLFKHRFGPKLDAATWKKARTRRTSGYEAWSELGIDTALLRWPEGHDLNGWIATIKGVVDAYSVKKALRADTRELLAWEAFFEALKAFSQLEMTGDLSFDAFRAGIFEILSEEKVPFLPGHGGVGVFEPDAMIGSAYDVVFVAGLSEGIYPGSVKDDAVVDFFERRALTANGIEFADAAEVARWEELSFFFTLTPAKDSVILSHASSVDNRESLASSFFDRLGLTPVPGKADIAASRSEHRRLVLRHDGFDDDDAMKAARHQRDVEASRESDKPYDEYDGVTGIGIDPSKRGWSVSQLTMIGQCGFKWWARKALELEEVSEIETGMDYTKRGTFYHKVLEVAALKAMGADNIREAILAVIDDAFVEAENDPETPLPMISNWELQRDEHLRAIKKAVKAPDFIKYGSTVVDVEKRFELMWNDFKMTGAIDRVDDTPDGLVAIDYKTSSKPPKGAKDNRGKLGVDIQIPIYAKVALPHLYPEGKFGESRYYSLTKGITLAPKRSSDLEPVVQLAARVRGDLGRGHFAVDPDTSLEACDYCEFDAVCRKGPRLERKNNV